MSDTEPTPGLRRPPDRFRDVRSVYQLKKAVLRPRTAWYRRKERDMEEPIHSMFEANYYRRQCYEFLGATVAHPDILVDVEADERSIVLDVGAYTGQWTSKVVDRYGCQVYAFEPAPAGVKRLHALFDDDPRVHVLPYGLGNEDQTVSMALAGPGSSIYADSSRIGFAEIQIRDVVGVLDELGLTRIDVLKVNIEGGEFDLLDRIIDSGWLRRTDQLLIQFHEWHPQAYYRRWRIRRVLARSHELVWDHPWVWESWRLPRP